MTKLKFPPVIAQDGLSNCSPSPVQNTADGSIGAEERHRAPSGSDSRKIRGSARCKPVASNMTAQRQGERELCVRRAKWRKMVAHYAKSTSMAYNQRGKQRSTKFRLHKLHRLKWTSTSASEFATTKDFEFNLLRINAFAILNCFHALKKNCNALMLSEISLGFVDECLPPILLPNLRSISEDSKHGRLSNELNSCFDQIKQQALLRRMRTHRADCQCQNGLTRSGY